jgi:hypothetical protein
MSIKFNRRRRCYINDVRWIKLCSVMIHCNALFMKLKWNQFNFSYPTRSKKFCHRTRRMSRSNIYSSAFPTTMFLFIRILFVFVSTYSVTSKPLSCSTNIINEQQHKVCNCQFNCSVIFGQICRALSNPLFFKAWFSTVYVLTTQGNKYFLFLVHSRPTLISDVGTAFLPTKSEHND